MSTSPVSVRAPAPGSDLALAPDPDTSPWAPWAVQGLVHDDVPIPTPVPVVQSLAPPPVPAPALRQILTPHPISTQILSQTPLPVPASVLCPTLGGSIADGHPGEQNKLHQDVCSGLPSWSSRVAAA